MIIAPLRIKRCYLKEIEQGTKTVEWRSDNPWNRRLMTAGITHLRFYADHLRDQIIVEVRSVDKMRRPEILENCGIEFTPWVFKIELGQVVQKGESYEDLF